MKIIGSILIIVITMFTARPVLDEMVYQYQAEQQTEALMEHLIPNSCCSEKHQAQEASSEDVSPCNTASHHKNKAQCCGGQDQASDCCSHTGDCKGQCQCSYSPVSLYQISAMSQPVVRTTEVEIKMRYTSFYSFNIPELIWHPPRQA